MEKKKTLFVMARTSYVATCLELRSAALLWRMVSSIRVTKYLVIRAILFRNYQGG